MYENKPKAEKADTQLQLVMEFPEEKKDWVKEKLDKLDPLRMTPMEALNALYELKMEKDHK